ncbi:hypothetical protein SOCE26_037320 [Sorangium cellulosum]|uniref:Secreted protein n=1 Tax=Sorangium cellulosum TaxID=56 RepID=A0A2L0ESR7_SORCE|nr:hypothetical protein [Sorangium cellulosum]AUX42302.1 hypothetical protein SOCE26_037320 [Sorangium cellulosum]
MKPSGRVFGMVMAVGLVSMACGPASQLEVEVDAPGLEVQKDKPGGQDTNGTPKQAWHTWKGTMANALRGPLLQGGAIQPAIIASGILADAEGKEVFDHTVRCALAEGAFVTHDGTVYKGRGLVNGASSWRTQWLPQEVIDSVMECVIAFVNDKTDLVNVLLTSLLTNHDGKDHSAFIHGEAVWCARAGTMGIVDVDVYPTRSFVSRCGIDAAAALEQRYCHEVGSCGLTYKGILEDRTDECAAVGPPEDGVYKCNRRACTMTWLEDAEPDWCDPPGPAPDSPSGGHTTRG